MLSGPFFIGNTIAGCRKTERNHEKYHIMDNNFYCIIMAGGVGSRFWPVSRTARPKQFIDILGMGKSFLQLTFDRMARIVPPENILIVTSEMYKDLVFEQIPSIAEDNVLLEPYKRNTAPCIAYATYKIREKNPEATVVVAPSDHLITDEVSFCNTISTALREASSNDYLYTIGITPTRPETNYGYIQINRNVTKEVDGHRAGKVKTFTEKPDEDMAKLFLETGEFVWNSGMFIWSVKSIMKELDVCLPDVSSIFKRGAGLYNTPSEAEFISRAYAECPSISIDYGVMEKTDRAWVFMADFGWNDVGTWNSIYNLSPNRNEDGNIIKSRVFMVDDTEGSIIESTDRNKLIVVKGLKNMMVVDCKDVLLVCPRDDKAIKDLITDLSMKDNAKEYL